MIFTADMTTGRNLMKSTGEPCVLETCKHGSEGASFAPSHGVIELYSEDTRGSDQANVINLSSLFIFLDGLRFSFFNGVAGFTRH